MIQLETLQTKFLWKPNKFPSPEEIPLQLMLKFNLNEPNPVITEL
jgi:hypothetical protein